jgi:predicted ester cyclase
VAGFYSRGGRLCVNGGTPALGRQAITEVVQGFMTAFPDLQVLLEGVVLKVDRAVYHWTLVGTNTAPGGTGHRVRVSGFEVWSFGGDGLIAESQGHFDNAAYQHQLEHGVERPG